MHTSMDQQIPVSARERFARAYAVLEEAVNQHVTPGAALGVLQAGQVQLADAVGRFTYEADAPAVVADTIYDVASLTKVVSTTAAAMLLVQRGQLDLETPLGELLPGFVVGREPGSAANRVRLSHLLAHNSGLPGYVEFFRSARNPAALFRACLELDLEATPGERAEYSDPGFILLGKALEVFTRQYLAGWVQREVFQPLNMRSTDYCPPPPLRALIPPTEIDNTTRQRVIQGEVQDENAWLLKGAGGHAGLFSNVPDLLRFAGEILNAWHGRPARIFERQTIERFIVRQGPAGSSRALGWDTPSANSSSGNHFSPLSIGHLGYSGCSLWIDLEADLAVVLLTNRTWPDRSNQAIKQLRPRLHDAVREVL